MQRLALGIGVLAFAAGCSSPITGVDAGPSPDVGGALDAPLAPDAGVDAGMTMDASSVDDAGTPSDVGSIDAPADTGALLDAGSLDAPTAVDGGPTSDAGSCVPPGSDLFALWRFDGDPGDSSPAARDLETFGVISYDPGGRFGSALTFPGDPSRNARRPADDATLAFGSSDFTIALWVQFANLAGGQVLLEDWSGFAGPGWTLNKLTDNRLEFATTLPTTIFVQSAILSWAPGWHLVVVRRAGDRLQIHRDGMLVAEQDVGTSAMATSDFPLLVGRRTTVETATVNGLALNGSMDELAIWRRALSLSDLDQLWNAGAGNPVCEP